MDRIIVTDREEFGDVGNCAGVQRHVLAHCAIAARSSRYQPPVAIDQAKRHPIDLQLAQVRGILIDLSLDTTNPPNQLVAVEHVIEAWHSLQMIRRREIGHKTRSTHQLRG